MTDEQQKPKGRKQKQEEQPSTDKYILLKNIKYKGNRYKIGQEIEIDADDREAFIEAGIIEG